MLKYGEYELVICDVDEATRVATVVLNRPEKLNATTKEMDDELRDVLQKIKQDAAVSVVILKGAGTSFCAGHDLTDWPPRKPYAATHTFFVEQRHILDRVSELREVIWEAPQPFIAQVHGYCLTVGVFLAMNCDLVVCASNAKLALRHAAAGAGQFTHMIPWLVNIRKAKELMFTGRYFSGVEAAQLGIANASVAQDELDDYVLAMATQIAKIPLPFLALDKQATNTALDLMGARLAIEYSGTIHAVARLMAESQDMMSRIKEDWRSAIAERDATYQPEKAV